MKTFFIILMLAMAYGMYAMKERDPIFIMAERWVALHREQFDRKMKRRVAFVAQLDQIADTTQTGERCLKRKIDLINDDTTK